jgi:putative transposase
MATMPEELVTMALQRAFWPNSPHPCCSCTPTGAASTGNAYRAILHRHGAERLQSRRGECCGNAQAESCWSRLKTDVLELCEWPVFADLADAQVSVADYFDHLQS